MRRTHESQMFSLIGDAVGDIHSNSKTLFNRVLVDVPIRRLEENIERNCATELEMALNEVNKKMLKIKSKESSI